MKSKLILASLLMVLLIFSACSSPSKKGSIAPKANKQTVKAANLDSPTIPGSTREIFLMGGSKGNDIYLFNGTAQAATLVAKNRVVIDISKKYLVVYNEDCIPEDPCGAARYQVLDREKSFSIVYDGPNIRYYSDDANSYIEYVGPNVTYLYYGGQRFITWSRQACINPVKVVTPKFTGELPGTICDLSNEISLDWVGNNLYYRWGTTYSETREGGFSKIYDSNTTSNFGEVQSIWGTFNPLKNVLSQSFQSLALQADGISEEVYKDKFGDANIVDHIIDETKTSVLLVSYSSSRCSYRIATIDNTSKSVSVSKVSKFPYSTEGIFACGVSFGRSVDELVFPPALMDGENTVELMNAKGEKLLEFDSKIAWSLAAVG